VSDPWVIAIVGGGDKEAIKRLFTRAIGNRGIELGTASQDALEFLRQHTVFV